ncbi:MAG: histidine--tRNA ligase [Alphaproteobacteria bacterium]|nr:histidine--tRNA ligase [Alphaproteobacteria bacterium]
MSDQPSKRKAKKQKKFKPKARTPRGFYDMAGDELHLQSHMLDTISRVYEAYGFEALDTSAFEYADALGKFLPDDDRPNEGVFALEDDDGQWMSLRYDLTAPLARHVAEHYDHLPKPLRRYQFGPVWRNEKPGPGRYRQFMQIDADTVGAGNQAADAEICMMAADCMEALGIERGDYVVRINNRKIMDGLLEAIGLDPQGEDFESRRLTILRAMDKYDRLGLDGVTALLGDGRKDESGDFTKGAGLDADQIDKVAQMVSISADDRTSALESMAALVKETESGKQGLDELVEMAALFTKLGYDADRLAIDPSVVRGLGYYTGPVYEIELTFEAQDESGELARFGSVGGGGRYDDLVKRFKGIEIPATGISIGVSRLAAALMLLGKSAAAASAPLVVVAVMDKDTRPDLMALVSELRAASIRAEMYMGDSAMKAQLRYADARGARLVVIEGEDERAKGVVTLKDLQLGAEKSAEIEDNAEWRASEHAQKQVTRAGLVAEIQKIIS